MISINDSLDEVSTVGFFCFSSIILVSDVLGCSNYKGNQFRGK